MISSSSRNIRRNCSLEVSRFSPPAITPQFQEEIKSDNQKSNESSGEAVCDPPPLNEEQEELLSEARQEARKILDEARKEAQFLQEKILNKAKEEAERLRQEAVKQGIEEGREAGRKEAELQSIRKTEKILECFKEDVQMAFANIEKAKRDTLQRYERELLDCAIAVAEKVIHISLRSSGEVMRRMILTSTEKLKKTAWVKIYIDSFDYSMMTEIDADVAAQLASLSDNIKFIIMDKEGEGTCIIEMPEGVIDTSVSTQMENIREILEGVKP